MKYYPQLISKGTFTFDDIINMTGNRATAYSLIRNYLEKRYIISIKRNLYCAISFESMQAVSNKYQIGSSITKSAYISHHSAFEFYGLTNQVFNELYVSSDSRFNDFDFEGVHYKHIRSKSDEGIVESQNVPGVRVTNLERTVIDSIKDFEKIGGLEDLIQCLDMITYLDIKKLEIYLELYNLHVLYQKTGYILEHFKNNMKLDNDFFDHCNTKIGKSTRYLFNQMDKDNSIYINKWQMIVPENLMKLTEQGGEELV